MIDLLLLVVIGGSTVLGLLRGFVGTLVSTTAWLLSGWVAFRFGEHAAFWLSDDGVPSASELFGGYAATFVAVMVVVTLVGMLIRSMVKSVGLSGVDRLLGMALGLLRGAFLGCLLVMLMGFTPMAKEPSWKQSQVLPLLLPGAQWLYSQLPDWSVSETDPRNAASTGDNGALENLPMPLLEGAVLQAMDSARERLVTGRSLPEAVDQAADKQSARKDPADIEATNIEAGGQDPANIESSGQDPVAGQEIPQHPNGQPRPKSK